MRGQRIAWGPPSRGGSVCPAKYGALYSSVQEVSTGEEEGQEGSV